MLVDACVEIPIIDFSPFVKEDIPGDTEGKQRVAQEIYGACHQIGFLYLTHHGIPQEAIARIFDQSRRFFALPDEEKQAIAWSDEQSNCGYVGLERERLDETKPGDLKEAFNIGRSLSRVSAENSETGSLIDLNQWPDKPKEFQQIATEFFGICAEAADRVFRAFAIALQMPESFIADKHQTHNYTLRLLHYPPLADAPKPGQTRAGAHSDYGTLTLLFQDDMGGLEVQTTTGEWISAPSIPDAILINTGDLLQRWSNDVFRSTKHRVALPQGENIGRDRYSIAFFCQPDAKTKIACLPSCQSSDNPPRYPLVTSDDYLLSRLRATY
jgi:isopenicillin N synthase-like dioxygenase